MDVGKAVLIQRRKYREPDLMDEFRALATTAGYEIIGSFNIVSPPSARFGIRSGKVEEIGTWIEVNEPEYVLFSPSLKSSQVFRLMEEWEIEVRDRTQIILEIFDRHARTPQAKLQIEQARLSYDLPFERHQIRMRLQKEHTGDRPVAEQIGAGEDLLNLRIRDIRRRLALIRDKLETISDSQELKKKRRIHLGFLEIAIAGYTNAGKSTLHRALTGSDVEIADELFTTLSTKAASLDIPGRQVVISDSVGFISDLPRALLQAFNTTLMEITDADVIVLVVDASDATEEMLRKVHASLDTFTKVGVNGIPIITALNKVDLLQEEDLFLRIDALSELCNSIIPISAQKETNLDQLLDAINEQLPNLFRYSVSIPYGDTGMSLISWLHDAASVENQKFVDGQMKVDVLLSLETLDRLRKKLPDDALTLLSIQSRKETS